MFHFPFLSSAHKKKIIKSCNLKSIAISVIIYSKYNLKEAKPMILQCGEVSVDCIFFQSSERDIFPHNYL